MNRIRTVARRELGGFFDQATAYILVVAFLVLGLFLSFRTIYAAGIATMRPFFDVLPWLFAIFLPAMTMRSLAEERRTATLEWLMAQPLREPEVVLGKFLGNWTFAVVALLGALPAGLGLLWVSDADPGIMAAQFTGGALLAAQGVAIGLWASSLTRNQITSFIVATAITFSLILIGTPLVGIGLPPYLSAAASNLSVLGHFDNVARGVIDLRDVLYFVSTAGLFVVLAIGRVSRERLSKERGAFRRLRTGTLALVAVTVVLNLLGSQLRGRIDLTRGNLYTLSEGTREILGSLDDLVTLRLVLSSELPPELQPTVRDVRDLVADLRRASNGQLVVEEIDPSGDDEAEQAARGLGIFPTEFNVLRDDAFEVRQGWFGLALQYADETESVPYISRTDDLEFRLVSTIRNMTTETRPRVGFVTAGGAKAATGYPALQQQLVERFDVVNVDLQFDSTATLDSVDVAVVAGPTQPLDEGVVSTLAEFMDAGGPAFVLVDANQINPQSPTTMPIPSGLEGYLEGRGVTVRDGMVLDWISNSNVQVPTQAGFALVRPYPLWPISVPAADHPIVRGINNISTAWSSALEITDSTVVTPLWATSEGGELQPPGGLILPEAMGAPNEDLLEVLTIAAAVEPTDGRGRLVVVGDANFLENNFVQGNPQNVLFAANVVDWLTQDEALISIRSKTRTPPALSFSSDLQRELLKWGNLAGVPLLFVLFGTVRVTGRTGRVRRRWEGFVDE